MKLLVHYNFPLCCHFSLIIAQTSVMERTRGSEQASSLGLSKSVPGQMTEPGTSDRGLTEVVSLFEARQSRVLHSLHVDEDSGVMKVTQSQCLAS